MRFQRGFLASLSQQSGGDTVESGEAAAPRGGEKRARILDAAIDVIAENGYFNARISDIAERAGVADGTVYLYFKSKDYILRAAIDAGFVNFFEQVHEVSVSKAPSSAKLESIARLHLEALAARRNVAILMQTEVRQSARFVSDFSHQHIVRYLNLVRDVVREGQASGELNSQLPDRLIAHCLFGALDEIVSSWVFTGRPYDAPTTARQIVSLLMGGIRRE